MKSFSLATAVAVSVTAAITARPACGHHSWSADYDLSRSTHVSGTVARVLLRNPHSALVLNVNADNGRHERWTVEWASPQRLRERGVTERTLRAGEEVLITGNPHRDSKVKSLRAVSVRRGDGTEIGNAASAGR